MKEKNDSLFLELNQRQKSLPDSIKTESIDGRRYYVTEGEQRKFPSITTILSLNSKKAIDDWIEKIGEEESRKISNRAKTKGTNIHLVFEKYLRRDPNFLANTTPIIRSAFYKTKENIDRITGIWHLEAPLYSNILGVAGRSDVIGLYDDTPAIIDFKTSRKKKKEEWIQNYFQQETAYSLMYFERTGIHIKKIVTIFHIEDTNSSVVYIKDAVGYIKPLKESIKRYYELYHPERIPDYVNNI